MKDTTIQKGTQGTSFSFDQLGDLFIEARSFTSPSQLHGLLCGQLGAGVRPSRESWLKIAVEQMSIVEAKSEQDLPVTVRSGLMALYDYVLADLGSEDFSFSLMLPETDATVAQRTEALGQWCGGFLSGFGMAGVARDKLSEEVSGVLTDLAQITLIQAEEREEDEDAERDLFEVCEYVRMAVLMLFNEHRGQEHKNNKTSAANHSVH